MKAGERNRERKEGTRKKKDRRRKRARKNERNWLQFLSPIIILFNGGDSA